MTGDIAGAPIAIVRKNSREEIRITFAEYQGHRYVDLRIFADDGVKPVPTKKGLALKPALLRPVIEALQRAEAEARAAGLLQ